MKQFLALTFILMIPSAAYAHKGHHHEHGEHSSQEPARTDKSETTVLKKIGATYKVSIKPIFAKKCMDCHSGSTVYPWYYKIPGIRQFIESDISEAREHMDISGDYPFKSHATPLEDLDAIREDTEEGSMPPFTYRLMHPTAKLTDEEKKVILEWVKQSRVLLDKK